MVTNISWMCANSIWVRIAANPISVRRCAVVWINMEARKQDGFRYIFRSYMTSDLCVYHRDKGTQISIYLSIYLSIFLSFYLSISQSLITTKHLWGCWVLWRGRHRQVCAKIHTITLHSRNIWKKLFRCFKTVINFSHFGLTNFV